MSPLGHEALLQHLRADTTTFRACLDDDLGRPVDACPGWDLAALGAHLGRVHRWAAAATTSTTKPAYPPPLGAEPLGEWYAASAAVLLAQLGARDGEQACWTLWPPAVTAFWVRRQALETAIHRWDAQAALGVAGDIDAALAAEGLTEVTEVMYPRQVALGRQPVLPVALELRSGDSVWVIGAGERLVLTADPGSLLLLVWKRLTLADVLAGGGHLAGDRRVADAVLGAALTP